MLKISRRNFLKMGLAMGAAWALPDLNRPTMQAFASAPGAFSMKVVNAPYTSWPQQTAWPAKYLPKFVQPLPLLGQGIPVVLPAAPGQPQQQIELHMREFQYNVLPAGTILPDQKIYTGTWVFGYRQPNQPDVPAGDSYIGPVVVATRNIPTEVKYVNDLKTGATTQVPAYRYSTDLTLHWADPDGLGMWMGSMDADGMMNMIPSPDSPFAQNYKNSIPAVPHLHGGEVPALIDGSPDSWFTSDGTKHGKAFYSKDQSSGNYCIYRYPNQQEPALIWFHDHTLGATRVNVYCGLAGAYLLQDPALFQGEYPELHPSLNPLGSQPMPTIPLVIQDRSFDVEGQFMLPAGPPNSHNAEHPYWVPEFVGDSIVVNGKLWPFVEVAPRRTRFLIINGSNARTYELFLTNPVSKANGPTIWQIGSDGGYLDKPARFDPNAIKPAPQHLVLMPGERADVIVDFAGKAGQTLILKNVAKTPYPGGETPNGDTVGKILQIRVTQPFSGSDASFNPATASRVRKTPLVRLTAAPSVKRQLTLNEIMGMPMLATDPVTGTPDTSFPGGPMEILVNNTKWAGVDHMAMEPRTYGDFTEDAISLVSELPKEGATELWEIVNLTADAHPIHLHLVQFQPLNRQSFDLNKYNEVYQKAFPTADFIPAFGPPGNYNLLSPKGKVGGNPDVDPFLKSIPVPVLANESGWKDTIQCPPGMVTRFLVRFAPTTAAGDAIGATYPFDPTNKDGADYVWHCHIIDHEDNEMMRPYTVVADPNVTAQRSYVKGTDY